MRFAIIGGGMAGILAAIKLSDDPSNEVTVFEKADSLGGTWRENTYPGLSCDVPSHLYSYSFALNPQWSHTYSPGEEIHQYLESVATEYNVHELVRFGDEVTQCEFADGRWHLRTASGHTATADVVIAATGVLHHPKYPDIDGLDSFGGAVFHSARWDHAAPVDDRRVGVIGTGSTAVQITSALVPRVAEFKLFQRTAQWVFQQDNPKYTPDEQTEFAENPDKLDRLHHELSDLFAEFANGVVDANSWQIEVMAKRCLENLEDNVADDDLRERLRPPDRAGCKRLVISADFYEKIQHPNAELVTDGIERVEPTGIRTTDGTLHELDTIVLATGFHADAFMRPMEVSGRGGAQLSDVWAERPSAYLSISIPEFPNFFMLNGPNGPVGNFSLIEVAELQFAYIDQLVDCIRSGNAREVSASVAATQEFDAQRIEAAKSTIWVTGCNSWYLDDRGIPAAWPWKFQEFRDRMVAPELDHFDLR